MKSEIKCSYKANVGAGAETFWKSEPEPERKQKVSAPQHWFKEVEGEGIWFLERNADPLRRKDKLKGS